MAIIGVISDTHGLLRPEACDYLQGSDYIVHAGDIGSPDVVSQLQKIAPLSIVRGNIDKSPWGDEFPEIEVLKVDGKYLYILHRLEDLDIDPQAAGMNVVISGHSHMPKEQWLDGVLYLNPGSAGPRRFKLPVSLARLTIADSGIRVEMKELAV